MFVDLKEVTFEYSLLSRTDRLYWFESQAGDGFLPWVFLCGRLCIHLVAQPLELL